MIGLIASVTNKEVSGADVTCENAWDIIVLDKSKDCPADAIPIKSDRNYAGDPKVLLGEKCCLEITGFSEDFWNARYSSNTNSCR